MKKTLRSPCWKPNNVPFCEMPAWHRSTSFPVCAVFLVVAVFAAFSPLSQAEENVEAIKTDVPERVEVVFVLDSTGSMSGLIEGAKQKIWAIANEIVCRKPAPEVKIGLITYRDKGDEYVTKMFDLTDDIDAVYGNLTTFKAAGGGDGPESVNQALNEAVCKMSWSDGKEQVYRVIFLVGDAPPHMDYQDDVKYEISCKEALDKNILINTIQCGTMADCTPIWQEIAKKGEGEYVQIGQQGDMVAVTTPFDEKIAALTRELNATVIGYGSRELRSEVSEKLRSAGSSSFAVQADRATFNAFSGGRAVQGAGDLVYEVSENGMDLSRLKDEELPENMKNMSADERQEYLNSQIAKRKIINEKISDLGRQRTDWLSEQSRANPTANSFDAKVSEMITTQMGGSKSE